MLFAGKGCLQKKNVLYLGSSMELRGAERKVAWGMGVRKGRLERVREGDEKAIRSSGDHVMMW